EGSPAPLRAPGTALWGNLGIYRCHHDGKSPGGAQACPRCPVHRGESWVSGVLAQDGSCPSIRIGAVAKVFVITGPSGVGKGTLIRELLRRLPGLELSVSATTRSPREGEVDDRDYHFLE